MQVQVQVNKTIEVLKAKYMKALISYDGLQRVETWPVPLPALREAVLNAVVHKDYTSGSPIQISVYADKLMIWNSGRLSPDWTVERLLGKHAPRRSIRMWRMHFFGVGRSSRGDAASSAWCKPAWRRDCRLRFCSWRTAGCG